MRICSEAKFLKKFASADAKNRKSLIIAASDNQVKALAECVINLNKFKNSQNQRLLNRKAQPLIRRLKVKRPISTDKLKKLFSSHHIVLAKLVGLVLLKFSEEALMCALTS
jgi:hypothetical protein